MMKATGIVRKVDELGRIVIPIELRRTMGIDIKDPLEIFVDGEKIILRKYEPTCIFSGSAENLINFKGKMISKDILDELNASFDRI
ncbi:AbrB/MazE/SpoVT family DNA-binding domain-containing protein [Paenibacillus sp. sgz500958]|uniref:AbrB/MazE/SpoVT family DNA-binding domain-containing protein n=1 Tax=Paenibacillus sp. sgz500958 TaxID=3242475 RepID=UPI0036D2FA22